MFHLKERYQLGHRDIRAGEEFKLESDCSFFSKVTPSRFKLNSVDNGNIAGEG